MARTDAIATLLSRSSFPLTIGGSISCRTLHAFASSQVLLKADVPQIRQQPHSISPLSSLLPQPALTSGGDFIGLSATIDHRNGTLIPVPEHLVPKKLLRWGQAPTCLQLLVSEDGDDDANCDAASAYWCRQTLTVFPETDCGIENLQTMRTVEQVERSRILHSTDSSVRVLIQTWMDNRGQKPRRMTVESTFGWFDEHRVRMVANVDIDSEPQACTSARTTTFHIQTPVQISLERQISAKRGTVDGAAAGGLDSQQLTMWMGQTLTKYSFFAETGSLGVWTTTTNSADPFDVPILTLPGNRTIFSWHSGKLWIIEMGHIFPQERLRRVVTITFRSTSDCDIATRVEKGELVPKVE